MKILVPTDFSENAIHAFEFAKKVTKLNRGSITLLFSYSTIYDFAAQAQTIVNEIETLANKTLKEEIRSSHYQGFTVDHKIMQGTVATAVLSTAYKEEYDLIIMGTQGASGLEETLIGSNTVDVIKDSKIPVLAVPPEAKYEKIKEITVAIELAGDEEKVFPKLMELTQHWNLPYRIIHIERREGGLKGLTFKELEDYLKMNYPLPLFSFTRIYAENAIEGINHYLTGAKATFLVMLFKNKTFFEHLFNQSHVVKMSYHTHVPLLVLKSPRM